MRKLKDWFFDVPIFDKQAEIFINQREIKINERIKKNESTRQLVRRRILPIIFILIIGSFLLFGCSSKEQNTNGANSKETTQKKDPRKEAKNALDKFLKSKTDKATIHSLDLTGYDRISFTEDISERFMSETKSAVNDEFSKYFTTSFILKFETDFANSYQIISDTEDNIGFNSTSSWKLSTFFTDVKENYGKELVFVKDFEIKESQPIKATEGRQYFEISKLTPYVINEFRPDNSLPQTINIEMIKEKNDWKINDTGDKK